MIRLRASEAVGRLLGGRAAVPVTPGRVDVLGCEIDRLDMVSTLERCRQLVEAGRPVHQVSINAAKIVALRRDSHLREIVSRCELVNADGQAVVWASRLLGRPLPERVAGIDLMLALLGLAEREGWRVYFLGARREALERAVKRLREQHPRLQVAGFRDGYFTDAESEAVCAEIRSASPQLLFVAMSSPRKEYWLGEHGARLGVPLAMGVGGAFDVVAGKTRRAPAVLQRAGLEWLFRLAQEPQRLGRRYLTTNARFIGLLAGELVGGRRSKVER